MTEAETVQDDLLAAPEQCEGCVGVLTSDLRSLASLFPRSTPSGLLARTENWKLDAGAPFATAFYHSDGNGNVTFLMYTNGMQAAKYLYDPYGNTLAMSGPLASANKYRFSSKEWNDNAGLYYYLYRFYDPNLQRWVNRDPIQEFGGINVYRFVKDNPISRRDSKGLQVVSIPIRIIIGILNPNPDKPETICSYLGAILDSPGAPPAQGPSATACSYACSYGIGDAPLETESENVTVFVGPCERCPSASSVAKNYPNGLPPVSNVPLPLP